MIVRLQLISGFYCVNLRKSRDPQLFQFLFMQIQNENGNNDQSKDHKDLRVEIRTIRSKLSVAALKYFLNGCLVGARLTTKEGRTT